MGIVYEGFDPVIGRTVAIKTMLTQGLAPADFEDFKARFQREAQAAGMLNHPNIVTVYDFGEDEGVLYLAMEFLEGTSLEDMMKDEGGLTAERIIPIFDQVCSALDHAHSFKIIHRDVKPANIMVLRTGLVKVTDFGIAKMMSMGMTQAGQILGTPNYMSPEQVRGRQIDGRSDQFSLGIILYELVTRERPFGGQNLTTIIYRIINENPIPPRELDSSIHPGLSYVIQKALAKDPDERYQTCRELAEDLKNYKHLGGAIAPSATVVMRVPRLPQTSVQPPVPTLPRPAPPRPAPVAPPPPEPAQHDFDLGEQPIARQAPRITVIPPAPPPQPKGSPLPWILFFLVLFGGGGGAYYFLVLQPKPPVQVVMVPSPTPPAPAPAQDPAPIADPNAAVPPLDGATATPGEGTAPGDQSATTTPAATPAEAAPPAKPATGTATPPVEPKPTRPAAPKVGSLAVTSNIPGAQITVDGKSDPSWVTPFTVPGLPAGNHSVLVVKDGYAVVQRNIVVEPGGAATLSVDLAVPSGEVNIITTPPGIDVLIDGQPAGRTPAQRSVKVGRHTFTLQAPGMEPYTSTFDIRSDGYVITKRVDLTGAVDVSTGVVEVRTVPPGARVTSGGKSIGSTTPTSIRLPAGRHMLSLSLEGFQTLHVGVEVPAEGNVTLNERLKAQ